MLSKTSAPRAQLYRTVSLCLSPSPTPLCLPPSLFVHSALKLSHNSESHFLYYSLALSDILVQAGSTPSPQTQTRVLSSRGNN